MTAAPVLQALNHSLTAKIKMSGKISRVETEKVMHPAKRRWLWEREKEKGRVAAFMRPSEGQCID